MPDINDEQLASVLHQIAENRVDEELDMWPELQDQINKLPRQKKATRLSVRMTLLLAAVLLVSVAAYALDYLGQLSPDPGLEAAGVTQINETQTIGDGTATLFYAYADANRLTVSYEVEWTWPANTRADFNTVAVLTDDQGRTYTPDFDTAGGGGGGGSSNAEGTPLPSVASRVIIENYDATIIDDQPEELNLRLELLIEMTEPGPASPPMSGGGGGGGGGNGSVDVVTTATPLPTMDPAELEDIGPFVFEFTVPFNPGRVMETPQTVEANAVAMTLQKAVITPSLARFELCFEQPETGMDAGEGWQPRLSIAVDGQDTDFMQMRPIESMISNGDSICHTYNVLEGLDDLEGDWTLTVDELVSPNSQDTLAVVEQLQAAGFEAEAFENGGFGISGYPDDMSDEEIAYLMTDIMEQTLEAYPGPWVFTFALD